MIEVRRGADRFVTAQPGITTRHCFSSGAHYDAANIAFGGLVALDEHDVAPGAGFSRHAHRAVEIVTWVLTGTLRHEEPFGRGLVVAAGTALHQSAGSGIEHAEVNASPDEPLRFVQMWLLGDVRTPWQELAVPPLAIGADTVAVLSPAAPTELAAAAHVHVFVTRGSLVAAGKRLEPGDSVRVRGERLTVEGDGEALVWRSGAAVSAATQVTDP